MARLAEIPKPDKELLAQALRRHPTWGDAYLEAREVLHDVEGCILAYWTDIPQSELERLRLRIRALDGPRGKRSRTTPEKRGRGTSIDLQGEAEL